MVAVAVGVVFVVVVAVAVVVAVGVMVVVGVAVVGGVVAVGVGGNPMKRKDTEWAIYRGTEDAPFPGEYWEETRTLASARKDLSHICEGMSGAEAKLYYIVKTTREIIK